MPIPPHLVIALAYDGLCTFEFGVVVTVSGLPQPKLAAIASPSRRSITVPLRTMGGIRVPADGGLELLEEAVEALPGQFFPAKMSDRQD